MDLFHPDYFLHAGNILLLIAYSVRDILWLRLFALASSLIAIPYFLHQPNPLWAALGWTVLFSAINLYQAWRLYAERRPVKLTPEEERVRQLIFQDLPPRKFLQVLSIGAWADTQTGDQLLTRGKSVDSISLIVRGKVKVASEDRILGELGEGDIVGSALLLSGTPADVDALAVGPVRSMRWEIGPLDRYLAANPETRIQMQKYLGRDLAAKLLKTNQYEISPETGAHSNV
ncbi:MAG: cyclic nucleotide-binding domain-containing protein [Candidatus Acidiferrum sp.]|jgi:hypothetical protein